MDFGSKLRHLRAQFGFTQAHVAELLNISTRSYGAYELNESQPRSKAGFEKLAAFYHVPLSFLYSDDDFHRNKKKTIQEKESYIKDAVDIVSFLLEQEGWFANRNFQGICYGDFLAIRQDSSVVMTVYLKLFKTQSIANVVKNGELFKLYGAMSTQSVSDPLKHSFLIVTNLLDFMKLATQNPPVNLHINIGIRFLDMRYKTLSRYQTLTTIADGCLLF